MPQMLSVDDELSIHQVLVQDFSASEDPITPAGVRTMDLLASAVSRQTSGYYSRLKYETPVMNAPCVLASAATTPSTTETSALPLCQHYVT
jgi:hypothetical protein